MLKHTTDQQANILSAYPANKTQSIEIIQSIDNSSVITGQLHEIIVSEHYKTLHYHIIKHYQTLSFIYDVSS